MERNLTDAFVVGALHRFQFDGTFATNWVYAVAIIPPCWVLVEDDNHHTELINLNNVARVFGSNFNKGDIEERN